MKINNRLFLLLVILVIIIVVVVSYYIRENDKQLKLRLLASLLKNASIIEEFQNATGQLPSSINNAYDYFNDSKIKLKRKLEKEPISGATQEVSQYDGTGGGVYSPKEIYIGVNLKKYKKIKKYFDPK